jgi:hypothetical protein
MTGNEFTGDLSTLEKFAEIGDIAGNWVEFKVDDYDVCAKVFVNSDYGIDESRISKMTIKKKRKCVYNYDRGEDVNPDNKEVKKIVKKIVKALK